MRCTKTAAHNTSAPTLTVIQRSEVGFSGVVDERLGHKGVRELDEELRTDG